MKTGLPYRRGKPSDRITTRFYFELFPLVQSIPCVREDGKNHGLLVGMTDITNLACRALGTEVGVFAPAENNRGK